MMPKPVNDEPEYRRIVEYECQCCFERVTDPIQHTIYDHAPQCNFKWKEVVMMKHWFRRPTRGVNYHWCVLRAHHDEENRKSHKCWCGVTYDD